jgi:2-polyprenyl-3-methyl-5-hydroxy-6-metoxy-1,4-benzoquinol methylase
MSFFVNTTYRSDAIEIMDDLSMSGELLTDTLYKLDSINKWLGGNAITLNGIKKLLKNYPKGKVLTIMDLGCGSGDMLRKVANYGRKEGYVFKLIGVDANEFIINHAQKKSSAYPEISYLQQDIFSEEFKESSYDIVLATLFLHHFKEDELIRLLSQVHQKANLGIVVNDLHRHGLAYYLFKLLGLGITNEMVKQDGLTSILRGFKKEELEEISKKLNVKSQIQWKWAFRYQWIIK